jgi:hypothetical protein
MLCRQIFFKRCEACSEVAGQHFEALFVKLDALNCTEVLSRKATQYLVKRAGLVLLCQINSLMMAPRCRNM